MLKRGAGSVGNHDALVRNAQQRQHVGHASRPRDVEPKRPIISGDEVRVSRWRVRVEHRQLEFEGRRDRMNLHLTESRAHDPAGRSSPRVEPCSYGWFRVLRDDPIHPRSNKVEINHRTALKAVFDAQHRLWEPSERVKEACGPTSDTDGSIAAWDRLEAEVRGPKSADESCRIPAACVSEDDLEAEASMG